MLSSLVKALLSLRYDVRVVGLESITSRRGVIVLPNHPAEIDPVIISTYLWDLLRPAPVVLETFAHHPLLRPIMKLIRAIPMPDMEFDSGPFKRRRIKRALEDVGERLRRGENILIYPSGRLSVTGEERLGAASGVHAIIREQPDIPVALVRIKGLYGSIFSKALTAGHTPDLVPTLAQAVRIALQNLLFLAPRRRVSIEIVFNPPNLPRLTDAQTFNRYLEEFYNAPEPEKASLVPRAFWSATLPALPERPIQNHTFDDIPEHIREKVFKHIAHISQTDSQKLTPNTQLGDELGLDSLTVAELLLWLDREFEAHDIDLSELVTVGSVLKAANGQLGSTTPKKEFCVPDIWASSLSSRPAPALLSTRTIQEAFLSVANTMGGAAALGDERTGVLRWTDAKTRIFLLARHISTIEGKHIGLLFPASVAGSLTAMATILAGKIPVFLNWTAGKRALLHACESTNLETIITSRSFLDIVQTDLEFLEGKFFFLEELRNQITWRDKIAAKRLQGESLPRLREAFSTATTHPTDPAVILFTSGSEALPKGVVLTHENILSNIAGVMDAFPLHREDALLGFLPTFHSFGLTVCTILPLVTGLRVAYHPNPNESRKIAKAVKNWGATIVAGTPTFLRSILQAGTTEQFGSLRTLISGAERAPEELFERVKGLPNPVEVLEGYGITECSPVVSLNRPGEARVGVGRPIGNTVIKIVHPASLEEISPDTDGLILIKSSSVFPGYLEQQLNPFVEVGGVKYYNSGDIGRLHNGSLIISGRLKRFIKIAGEMVSLTAVEEALQKRLPTFDDAPSVAVIAKGTEGEARPTLVLFTSTDTSTESANSILKEAGFPHLVALSNVIKVRELPLLGSGKTDYQTLQRMV